MLPRRCRRQARSASWPSASASRSVRRCRASPLPRLAAGHRSASCAGLAGGRMVAELPHARRQHFRPRVARPRLLAAAARLRAARRRCAHPPAPRPAGTGRGACRGGGRHRPCCCSRGLERSLGACKEYANRADSFWQRGAPASVRWPSARWRRRCSSACRSASSAIAVRGCAPPMLQVLNIVQTIPASRCSAS